MDSQSREHICRLAAALFGSARLEFRVSFGIEPSGLLRADIRLRVPDLAASASLQDSLLSALLSLIEKIPSAAHQIPKGSSFRLYRREQSGRKDGGRLCRPH